MSDARLFEVRIHGRGGQGVVTAAELLSVAAFDEGRHAQAFPSFGSERTGAPVVSYCRMSDQPIRSREPVVAPDAVVIQDATLVHQVDLFAGLSADGYALVNTSRRFDELDLDAFVTALRPERLVTCPATEIALEHLGRPLPNAALLGGFAALTGQVSLAAIQRAIGERFDGAVGERNAAAAAAAFAHVARESERIIGAPTD
ncbi:MAG: 2-oxoacid:acceptor oxidoreductase family protein [Acidimicrobiales bacterium]